MFLRLIRDPPTWQSIFLRLGFQGIPSESTRMVSGQRREPFNRMYCKNYYDCPFSRNAHPRLRGTMNLAPRSSRESQKNIRIDPSWTYFERRLKFQLKHWPI